VTCRSASCEKGVATQAAGCDGAGSCSPAQSERCGAFTSDVDSCRSSCANDADCSTDGSTVCACPGHVKEVAGAGTDPTCVADGACDKSIGRCVLADCRDSVASFHRKKCADSPTRASCTVDLNACSLAGEECKFLACVDRTLGNFEDRRLEMLGR
jgi:5'-nucleotidase